MIYLLYGDEEILHENEIKKIITSNHIDSLNISRYDLDVDVINNAIDDATMMPIWGDRKAIVVTNAYLFTDTTKRGVMDQNPTIVEEYLNHPNESSIVIFDVIAEKISERKKISKLIKEKGTIINLNNIDYKSFIKELFKGYKINSTDIDFLLNRVGTEKGILEKEIEKLKIYKIDDKIVNHDDIVELVPKVIDVNIFHFIDNIVNNNKKEAIITYKELLKLNEEPIMIIVMLANQFRLMFQAKQLSSEGYSENDIVQLLKINPYRVKLALRNSSKFSINTLLHYLKLLGNLDIAIKSGSVDKDLALELFILGNN